MLPGISGQPPVIMPELLSVVSRSDGNDTGNYSWGSLAIGDPSPDRTVFALTETKDNDGDSTHRCLINGVNATKIGDINTSFVRMNLFAMLVPDGTTATFFHDVVANDSDEGAITVFSFKGLQGLPAKDIAYGGGGSPATATFNSAGGQVVFGWGYLDGSGFAYDDMILIQEYSRHAVAYKILQGGETSIRANATSFGATVL